MDGDGQGGSEEVKGCKIGLDKWGDDGYCDDGKLGGYKGTRVNVGVYVLEDGEESGWGL